MKHVLILLFAVGAFAQDKDKIKVVTTLNILKHLTEEIGGNRVEVTALAHPKQDPHYVSPTPDLTRLAQDARLFVHIGRGLDLWAKNIWDASGNTKIQPGSDGNCAASQNCGVEELPSAVGREWGDIHPEGNPHVWLGPENVREMAKNIAGALSKIDAANAAGYKANLEAFLKKIDEAMFGASLVKDIGADVLWRKLRAGKLDTWLKDKKLEAGGWWKKSQPLRGAKVISYHKTYAYFEKTFGFEIVAELEEKPGFPPPPKQRDAIVALVKQQGVKVILNDIFYDAKPAEYVAENTGAKVLIVPIDVGAIEGAETYTKLVDYLLDKLAGALK